MLDSFSRANVRNEAQTSVSRNTACLYLGITDATVSPMLADDRGLGLFKLELSGNSVEEESLTPLYHTGHLIITNTQIHISASKYTITAINCNCTEQKNKSKKKQSM